jgi:hypothetical protein
MFFEKNTLHKKAGMSIPVLILILLLSGCMSNNEQPKNDEQSLKPDPNAPAMWQVGDYVQFGKYDGKPIVWRVIQLNEDADPLLFSAAPITHRVFDANGEDPQDRDPDGERASFGSNNYEGSNLRQWLNSSATQIDWLQKPPTLGNILTYEGTEDARKNPGKLPYADEPGFLSDQNFSEAERAWIIPYEHNVLLDAVDQEDRDGGTLAIANFIESYDFKKIVENYDNIYYKTLTDRVFLLSIRQWQQLYKDQLSLLGETQNSEKDTRFWLNTPCGSMSSYVCFGESFDSASIEDFGVRPALQLKWVSVFGNFAGQGTKEKPYVVIAGD